MKVRRATDAFAVLIALAGFAVSYRTQVQLASDHGFPGWEAWLWPGIADAAALAMVLRLQVGAVRAGWYTVEAWCVFAVASAVMVGANAIADRADPLGGAMHAVVPIVGMLVWHVVIHGRPAEQPGRRGAVRDASAVEGGKSSRARPRRTAKARIAALLDADPPPATAELAKKLGVSPGHVRKARAEARRRAA